MARDINAATITELSSRVVRPVLLLKLEFDSSDGGDINYWNGIGDFLFDGDTYAGVGGLARITTIQEESGLQAAGAKFELSGIPSANLSMALTLNYQERNAKLWLGFVDSTQAIIGDAILLFSGRMDVMEIEESGKTATVAITVENRLIDLERSKLRHYTDADQKTYYPSDKGLSEIAAINNGQEITWGPTG
jgi:hypothetical protein